MERLSDILNLVKHFVGPQMTHCKCGSKLNERGYCAIYDKRQEFKKWHGRNMEDIDTLHYCPEWDYLLIDKSCPEFESCSCYDA